MLTKIYLFFFGIALISIQPLYSMQAQRQNDSAREACRTILAIAADTKMIDECLILSQLAVRPEFFAEMAQTIAFLRKNLKDCKDSLSTLQAHNLHEVIRICYPLNTDTLAQKFLAENVHEAFKVIPSTLDEGTAPYYHLLKKETWEFFKTLEQACDGNQSIARLASLSSAEIGEIINFLKLRNLLLFKYQMYAALEDHRRTSESKLTKLLLNTVKITNVDRFAAINYLLSLTGIVMLTMSFYTGDYLHCLANYLALGLCFWQYHKVSPACSLLCFVGLLDAKIKADKKVVTALEALIKIRQAAAGAV